MSLTDLSVWASNFARLRQIFTSAPVPGSPTGFSRWHGADQLLAPQFQAMVPMMMPLVTAGLLAGGTQAIESLPEQLRVDGREDLLLFGRYMLELTALKRDNASIDRVQAVLPDLLERLEGVARSWASAGVDPEERQVLVEETRKLGLRLHGQNPNAA